jgi:restriction endonuclease S subunit
MKTVSLKEIAALSTGHLFSSKVEHDPGGTIRVVQMRNIGEGELDLRDALLIQDSGAIKPQYRLQEGDVLFRTRNTPNTAAIVGKDVGNAIAAAPIIMIRVKPQKVDPGYLVWFLNHPVGQSRLQRSSRGSNMPMINKADLAEFEVDLPPMQMQQQIAKVAELQRQERKIAEQLAVKRQQYLEASLMRCVQVS